MIERLLAALFGKRYRKGWPRGVRPVAPWIEGVKRSHPDLWAEVRHLPAVEGIRRLREAGAL